MNLMIYSIDPKPDFYKVVQQMTLLKWNVFIYYQTPNSLFHKFHNQQTALSFEEACNDFIATHKDDTIFILDTIRLIGIATFADIKEITETTKEAISQNDDCLRVKTPKTISFQTIKHKLKISGFKDIILNLSNAIHLP